MNPQFLSKFCFLKLLACCSLAANPIDLTVGTAAQTTTLGGFGASLAIDGLSNFTHTLRIDDDPTWQVLLPQNQLFEEITLSQPYFRFSKAK